MTARMNAKRAEAGKTAKKQRPAAVLVPLCTVDEEPAILFTLRSAALSSHAGQISFPGGHADCDGEEREDPVFTAVRETKEELLGHCAAEELPSYDFDQDLEILGQTGLVPAATGNMVTPIVGALTRDIPSHDAIRHIFPGNPGEVDEVFAVSVAKLLEGETSEELKRLGTMGPVFPLPAPVGEGKIWGLTAIVLRPILHKVLRPAGFFSPWTSATETSKL
jgi:8-oxo-dGTP pyrophosphatase MutT (NUDIX family)